METVVNGESNLSDALVGLRSVKITQATDCRDSVIATSLRLFALLNVPYCGSFLTSPDVKNAKIKQERSVRASHRAFAHYALCGNIHNDVF